MATPSDRVLDYFLNDYDKNGQIKGQTGRKPEDFIRAVRVRSSIPKPKYQGGTDQIVFLYKSGKKEFTFWVRSHNVSESGKISLGISTFISFFKEMSSKDDLDEFINNDQQQIDFINQTIGPWKYFNSDPNTYSIIQDPWDPDVIPTQEIAPPPPPEPPKSTVAEQPVTQIPPQPKDPNLIKSKITLRKVSGPGEIIGVVEQDALDGKVEFSGIQFSDPGDYVIEVVPSNKEDLKGTTFSITVAEESIDEEQPQTVEESKTEGSRPIIAQIDEPRIKLQPISFSAPSSQEDSKSIMESTGNVPYIHYAGAQIKPSDIEIMELYYEDNVPKIRLSVYDTLGRLRQPESDPIVSPTIELFLNSNSTVLKSIHLKFIITSNSVKRNGSIALMGSLDIRDFYKSSYKSYKMTSFDALRTFASDMSLGFNSNIDITNDTQVWSRKGGTGSDFLKEIFQHAYINDETFVMAYIDYYYCLNYVDVQKEYDRDNSSDVGLVSGGVSLISDDVEEDRIVPLVLTNENKNQSSPFSFAEPPRFINKTESQKVKFGTQTETKSYDRLGKRFLVWVVDAITGDQTTNVETRTPDDMATNTKPSYRGKIDTDSVHPMYKESYDRQFRNLTQLLNNQVEIIIPTPNFNLYKYQNIKLVFVNQKQTVTNTNEIDVRNSGNWIILDIRFIFKKGTLSQKVTLVRKQLNKTQEEMETQVVEQDSSGNAEINENPEVPGENKPVPNQVYYVGQKVLVEQNGTQYIIEVTSILDNGIDIEGTITQFGSTNQTTIPETQKSETTTDDSIQAPITNPGEYLVEILNPKNETEAKINGIIKIKKTGTLKETEGNLSGFTDGGTIRLIDEKSSAEDDTLVTSMLNRLRNEMVNKYGETGINLVLKNTDQTVFGPINNTSKLGYKYEVLKPNVFQIIIVVKDKDGNVIDTVSNNSNPYATESELIIQAKTKVRDI